MVARFRPNSFCHAFAVIVMAYALILGGILGAMASAGHAQQLNLAAQLGMICTTHGMVDPQPGKLACIEHCVLAAGQLAAATAPNHAAAARSNDASTTERPLTPGFAPGLIAAWPQPPPSRGPPYLA